MRKVQQFLSISALLIAGFSLSSCNSITGTGPLVTVARQEGAVDAIDLEMDAQVYLMKSDSQSIVIKAQQNIIDVLSTKVNDGKLEIKTLESISVTEPIEIWVNMKMLKEVELNGSGKIQSDSEFNGEKVEVDLSGSGDIFLKLNVEKLEAELSGSGDINLQGKAEKGNFDLRGSGNILAESFDIDQCEVDLSGSGQAKVKANSSLDVKINGSGNVYYRGQPQKVKSDVNGSGKIEKVE